MSPFRTFRHAGRSSLLLLLSCMSICTAAFAGTTGEQKTAVLLVNFQDDASQSISRDAAHALVFGQVSDFYWEASYQKTFLSGDTYGWYTIPVSKSVCDVDLFAREADRAAAAAGVDLSGYDRLIYLMPDNVCSVAGYNSGPDTVPTRTWLLSNNLTSRVVAHELGHNFGLTHSQSTDCGASSLGGSCSNDNYGDPSDTMGSGATPHFNAVQKDKLGWIGTAGQPAVTTVTSSGSYALAPMETATGVKALKIQRGVDPATGYPSYYYIEYRQPIGFDTVLGTVGNLTAGVQVRIGGKEQNPVVLDMTPDSAPSSSYQDIRDSALAVGRTYSDASAGITITLRSVDAAGAVVDIGITGSGAPATCVRAAPSLSLTGPSGAVPAGSTKTYTVALVNRDSSACAATRFDLARSVPAGWNGTLAASNLTLSPGASATTTLSVTSATSAAAGDHGIGASSASTASSIHAASASALYTVSAPAGALPLSETVGTDKTSYLRGESVAMSARVSSNGVAIAGAAVRFTVGLPSGGSSVLTATSGSDGYARVVFKTGKGKSATGQYQLRADATRDGASATASTAFSVR